MRILTKVYLNCNKKESFRIPHLRTQARKKNSTEKESVHMTDKNTNKTPTEHILRDPKTKADTLILPTKHALTDTQHSKITLRNKPRLVKQTESTSIENVAESNENFRNRTKEIIENFTSECVI